MPYYDFFCDCGSQVKDHFQSFKDPWPLCDKCGKQLQRDFSSQTVVFRGFTTPGGNGNPNYKRLPAEIRKWAKQKNDQDKHFEEEVKKPKVWPDGTVQRRIK